MLNTCNQRELHQLCVCVSNCAYDIEWYDIPGICKKRLFSAFLNIIQSWSVQEPRVDHTLLYICVEYFFSILFCPVIVFWSIADRRWIIQRVLWFKSKLIKIATIKSGQFMEMKQHIFFDYLCGIILHEKKNNVSLLKMLYQSWMDSSFIESMCFHMTEFTLENQNLFSIRRVIIIELCQFSQSSPYHNYLKYE